MSVEEHVRSLPVGTIVHPKEIADLFGLDMHDTYMSLSAIEDAGLLTIMLEPFCTHCNKFAGEYYESFFDFPTTYVCPHCGGQISLAEDAIVVFRRTEKK